MEIKPVGRCGPGLHRVPRHPAEEHDCVHVHDERGIEAGSAYQELVGKLATKINAISEVPIAWRRQASRSVDGAISDIACPFFAV